MEPVDCQRRSYFLLFLHCSPQAVWTKPSCSCTLESPSQRRLLVTARSKWRCDPWCRKDVFPKALFAAKHTLILPLRDGRAPVPARFRTPAAEPHHELCGLSQTLLFLQPPPSSFLFHWIHLEALQMRKLFL